MAGAGVVVAGYVTYGPGEVDRLSAEMDAVIGATREEPGCQLYTYARLREDPDTIRIFEIWDSEDALRAHFKTPHMALWMEIGAKADVRGREVNVYPFSAVHPASYFR